MAIILQEDTRVLIQGMTGNFGSFHSAAMLAYGTNIVAGVTPGKGGTEVNHVPIYDDVATAAARHEANVCAVLVPAPFVKDAVFEALDAGIRIIVCLVEGVPVKDTILMKKKLLEHQALMIGPNSPGLISPGIGVVGFMPGNIYQPGPVGIVSRSGTFSYLVADALSKASLGQSTALGIGGDPISGINYDQVLSMFEADDQTKVIVMVGEIGRTSEEEAARYIQSNIKKPVIAMVLGQTAPPGKQMGHAGAIITAGKGNYVTKVEALQEAGITVVKTTAELGQRVRKALT
ncbi:MAG: succinate--CoA ligase subunit alpha [Desulfitobacteriaceae bacterium]